MEEEFVESVVNCARMRGGCLFNKSFGTKVLAVFICLSLLISSTAQTGFSGNNFDSTLAKWLGYVGFNGDVLEYQKLYNETGYLDYFRILLQEREQPKNTERTQAKIFLEITDNEAYEFTNVKIIEKDIKDLPYMYTDWIARLAISYAVKKVSKLMGLKAETEKVKGDLYKVTIDPAAATVPSRYRFTQIVVFYEIKDLLLTLDVTIKGEKDYLMLSFFKSEIHGILRTLENGNFPGATSATLVSGLLQGSSSYLIHDLLKVPEASREILLLLEHNPELTIEELNP